MITVPRFHLILRKIVIDPGGFLHQYRYPNFTTVETLGMLANYDLKDKKVLVTGGASGIGLGTVEAFLRCGASVAINDLPGNILDDQVSRLSADGHSVRAQPVDAKLAPVFVD